ncbi:hypothetical protein NA57DRAFT_60322 [Rhizodiscina lignyota]|uniref:Uncharacterized protein n=1 Tax=Rhizodiscina lignyota TaxID=1504668 RepID=A0A9P4M2R8_9PEZI|nr:hypothetical protein NA57DRAFT_60322 [Rhizodiscina lignyota]
MLQASKTRQNTRPGMLLQFLMCRERISQSVGLTRPRAMLGIALGLHCASGNGAHGSLHNSAKCYGPNEVFRIDSSRARPHACLALIRSRELGRARVIGSGISSCCAFASCGMLAAVGQRPPCAVLGVPGTSLGRLGKTPKEVSGRPIAPKSPSFGPSEDCLRPPHGLRGIVAIAFGFARARSAEASAVEPPSAVRTRWPSPWLARAFCTWPLANKGPSALGPPEEEVDT